jgi:hypothetical protein
MPAFVALMYPEANLARAFSWTGSVKQVPLPGRAGIVLCHARGGGPRGNEKGLPLRGRLRRRDGAEAGVRPDDGEDVFLLDEASGRLGGRFGSALAVLDHEAEEVLRARDLHTARVVDLRDRELRGLLAGVADGTDIAGQLGDHADLDVGPALPAGRLGEEHAAEDPGEEECRRFESKVPLHNQVAYFRTGPRSNRDTV